MLLAYDVYYKRFGIRRLNQFYTPNVFKVDFIQLSREAQYHFVSHDPEITLPDSNDLLFRAYNKKILIEHIDTLFSEEGHPKHLNKMVKSLVRPWHLANNSRFRMVVDNKVQYDPSTLLIYNYGILNEVYRYVPAPMSEFYHWFNIEKTVWHQVNESCKENQKYQFIIKDLPLILPAPSILKMNQETNVPRLLKIFNTPELLSVLDFWRWLNPETRHLSSMSALETEQLKYVNIVFRFKGYFAVLNLHHLESWSKQTTIKDLPNTIQQVEPLILQRLFIKSLLSIQTKTNTDELPEEDITATDSPVEGDLLEQEEEDNQPEVLQEVAQSVNQPEYSKQVDDTDLSDDGDLNLDALQVEMDRDLEVLDKLHTARHIDLEEEDELNETHYLASEEEIAAIQTEVLAPVDPFDKMEKELNWQAEQGAMTAQTYRGLIKQLNESKQLKSPYDAKQTIYSYAKIKPEELKIDPEKTKMPEDLGKHDPSMIKSSLNQFDKKYTRDILPKDIVGNITKLTNAGIIVRDYEVEQESSAMGQYEVHRVKIKPIDGMESTLSIRLPKVNDEGEMLAGGSKYRMRKQRFDQPIRKIGSDSVALASYYGKVFVNRSDRKQFDEMDWLSNQLTLIGLEGGNDLIKKVTPGKVFINTNKTPAIYSSLAMRFKQIQLKTLTLDFDSSAISIYTDEKTATFLKNNNYQVCGFTNKQEPVVVDYQNNFSVYREGNFQPLGDIYTLSGINIADAPIQFSELKVFAKTIPLGVVLGYYLGLDKLIKLMKPKFTLIDRNKRIQLQPYEYRLNFKDKSLILDRRDTRNALLFAGFNFYRDTIKHHPISNFNQKDVYLLLLDQRGLSARYLKELDNLNDMFVDAITEEILVEMKEPQTFKGLLFRANELLLTDYYPDTNDMRFMRIKGYERIAGMMYKEIINSVREYRTKNIRGKSQVSIAPYQVWRAVTQDQAVKLSEDINPINDIKEMEAVTYVGSDGRSKDAMTKEAREYHPTDMGVISEATVDSGEVAINTYLSTNPKFTSLRGLPGQYNEQEDGLSSLLSSSAINTPFSVNDDSKRVNFISVQNAHTVACHGYHQPQIRTGYENIIPYRVGKMYAYMAEDDGKVIELSESNILIEYKDKRQVGVAIGRQYGRAEGSIYPHDIKTVLKKGQSFKKDDPIAYNSNFFEEDFLNPKRIIMKSSLKTQIALMETTQTLEDASSIAPTLSERLQTTIIKERVFVVNFNQNIRNVTPPGTKIGPRDVLFIVEDPITAGLDVFDSDTIESLSRLSNLAPRAKVNGSLDRYEIFYNGEIEDMTPSLKKMVNYSNKQFYERSKNTDHEVRNGRVTEEFRVEGKPLQLDTLVIKVYIAIEEKAALGDKLVFAAQLKSVNSEVLSYPIKTESGAPIDALFGYRSIGNRIVLSATLAGTTSTLLDVVAKKAVELYKS